ncbi:lysozyme inhibitor LprI family protein [Variovorax paradoxus]|nr:lysozyme inhibitor LprI family protein [Variovorax paradoxus]
MSRLLVLLTTRWAMWTAFFSVAMHAERSRERSIYIRVELAKSVGHRCIFFAARSKNKVWGLCNESTKDPRGDQRTGKLLVDAQKKWLGFRDAECALQTVRTTGGSIQSMTVAI